MSTRKLAQSTQLPETDLEIFLIFSKLLFSRNVYVNILAKKNSLKKSKTQNIDGNSSTTDSSRRDDSAHFFIFSEFNYFGKIRRYRFFLIYMRKSTL